MNWLSEVRRSALASIWFVFLTFPFLVMKVNTIGLDNVTVYRWKNMLAIGVVAFILSFVWRYLLARKDKGSGRKPSEESAGLFHRVKVLFSERRVWLPSLTVALLIVVIFPFVTSLYQTTIMISALIYILLGLGLNIVVGLGGLLNLGYAAFYAVGAYTYALLYRYLNDLFVGLGWAPELMFWLAFPMAGVVSTLFGILLALPVLRLRGDYLAIVTLAFAEIVKMVLTNTDKVTLGPSGIPGIPRPWFFGLKMTPITASKVLYFIVILLVGLTIVIVRRLEHSRLGRTWEALREDEIASQAMGINIMRTKLSAFALGALWAGFAGVLLAAKTTVVNPNSFTIWESVIILCVVVLGGMGSVLGVVVGALIIVLLPEYLRAFSEYRMLIFGALLVVMMIFRPEGIIRKIRRRYEFDKGEV